MTEEPSSWDPEASSKIDTTIAHSPRIWNYWLGGRDNYTVDREVGDQFYGVYPPIVDVARASRAFQVRAVTYLAAEAGIHQFLDIGTGLPTADNTHEIAQRARPDASIVYVDNDPMVLAHARALLTSTPEGSTRYIDADLREPEAVVDAARKTLDFDRPIALMLLNILGHIPELADAQSIVGRLLAALPAGSYLAVADGTNVVTGKAFDDAIAIWNQAGSLSYHLRTPDQIGRFFEGLELLEPGVVSCPRWRPEPGSSEPPAEVDEFCAVGRKA